MILDQKDIVFTTIPYTDTTVPLMAPAVLKSIATKANKSSVAVDLNIQAIKFIEDHQYKHEILNFFHDGLTISEIEQDLFDLHLKFAQQLLAYRPKIIGLSVFTYNCQVSARYLSMFIKKLDPTVKIILGGNGLIDNLAGPARFADSMVASQLVDFYIRGDAEKVLYDYLVTEQMNLIGINTQQWDGLTNEDLMALPMPDYDDYDMDQYSNKAVSILGSRGCVRRCSFCDIHAHWTKFSYRTGQHIFDEMTSLSKKYNIYHFMFQDSLINGNLKEYRELMRLIAEYNNSAEEKKKFIWSSFWILRPKDTFTEEDWRLTAEGGGLRLLVGIETFNDLARFHLGKKFTNEDIEFGLQMAKKYNIRLTLLFLIGYVTESEKDIDDAVTWWENHTEYRDVIDVNLGSPLGILHQTPLQRDFDKLKLVKVGPHDQDWINPATDNTPLKRVEWYQRLSDTLARLGYNEIRPTDNRFIMEKMLKDFQ
jgi:radical SAM superfamily enzyme YgiQ (UPF0313 family)